MHDLIPTTTTTNDQLAMALAGWLHSHGKRFEVDTEGNQVIRHSRTSKAYEETMGMFVRLLHKESLHLDSDPSHVALVAQGFAHSPAKGKEAKKSTVNHRLACLSSFY